MSITLRTLAMLSVLIAGGLSAANARSDDSTVVLDGAEASTTTALESRIAALEAQLQQSMTGGYEAQEMPGDAAYGPAADGCGCGKAHGCGGAYCPPPCSNGCCCCPHNPWTLSAGVYHVKPHWKTNPAFSTEVTVGGVETTTQTDFEYDADVAPFVFLTYRTRYGLGVQARGWWYDDSASIGVVNPGGGTEIFTAAPLGLGADSDDAGDALTFDSSLQIDVVDFLLTYQMQFDCGSLEFAAGARYARIEQAYRYSQVSAGGGLVEDAIDSSHRFDGAGPSFSLEGRLSATRRLTLFATCRYSLLFGHAEQAASLRDDNILEDQNFQENDDLLPIAELDLGAEYALRIGCSELFISAAFVSQVWQGAGNSANNDIILTDDDPQDVSDKNADLGLWGLRAEIGARF